VLDQPVNDRVAEGEELDLLALQGDRQIEGDEPVALDPVLLREHVLELGAEPELEDASVLRVALDLDAELRQRAQHEALDMLRADGSRPLQKRVDLLLAVGACVHDQIAEPFLGLARLGDPRFDPGLERLELTLGLLLGQ
jgi:hypothetical protein